MQKLPIDRYKNNRAGWYRDLCMAITAKTANQLLTCAANDLIEAKQYLPLGIQKTIGLYDINNAEELSPKKKDKLNELLRIALCLCNGCIKNTAVYCSNDDKIYYESYISNTTLFHCFIALDYLANGFALNKNYAENGMPVTCNIYSSMRNDDPFEAWIPYLKSVFPKIKFKLHYKE